MQQHPSAPVKAPESSTRANGASQRQQVQGRKPIVNANDANGPNGKSRNAQYRADRRCSGDQVGSIEAVHSHSDGTVLTASLHAKDGNQFL